MCMSIHHCNWNTPCCYSNIPGLYIHHHNSWGCYYLWCSTHLFAVVVNGRWRVVRDSDKHSARYQNSCASWLNERFIQPSMHCIDTMNNSKATLKNLSVKWKTTGYTDCRNKGWQKSITILVRNSILHKTFLPGVAEATFDRSGNICTVIKGRSKF